MYYPNCSTGLLILCLTHKLHQLQVNQVIIEQVLRPNVVNIIHVHVVPGPRHLLRVGGEVQLEVAHVEGELGVGEAGGGRQEVVEEGGEVGQAGAVQLPGEGGRGVLGLGLVAPRPGEERAGRLGGHAGVLVVGGVRRLVRVRPGQWRHGARPGGR